MGAGGKWQKIIYERVPKFCSHCMLRGHDNESCRHLLNLWKKEKKPQMGSESLSQRPNHNRASPKWVRPNSRPQILTKAIEFHQNNQIVIQPSDKETSTRIPTQRKSMKLNKHSQQNNCIEISSTDLIVHDPAPSALNTLIHQSTHDDINASNPQTSSLIAISLRTSILISFQKKRHWQISLRKNPILIENSLS